MGVIPRVDAAAPPVLEHAGSAVSWEPWETAPLPLCPRAHAPCEGCGYGGALLTTHGIVEHRETASERAQARIEARAARRPVPASGVVRTFPRRRLVAFRCPECGDLRVYDTGPDGLDWTAVDVAQPTLFDAVPGG